MARSGEAARAAAPRRRPDGGARARSDHYRARRERLTHERLREVLDYDPATGLFTWRVRTGPRCKIGDAAGTLHKKGYVRIKVDGVYYAAHRLAWLYVTGRWPHEQVDHRNRSRADNRWMNLRLATNSQNQANSLSRRSERGEGLKGAYRTRQGRWQAIIRRERRAVFLGTFNTEQEAHAAYLNAAIHQHGEFARGS